METPVKYAIGGVMALIIFFAMTPLVSSQLDTAQNNFDVYSNNSELTGIATTQNNVLITNDSVQVNDTAASSEYSATVSGSDQVEVTVSEVTGEVTIGGTTYNETGDYRVSGESVTVTTDGGGDDYTITAVTGVEERSNADIFALVFLIFTVAFAGAIYKTVM